MGEELVSLFVTAVVAVAIVGIVYQLSNKSGGTKLALGGEQTISSVAGDFFK